MLSRHGLQDTSSTFLCPFITSYIGKQLVQMDWRNLQAWRKLHQTSNYWEISTCWWMLIAKDIKELLQKTSLLEAHICAFLVYSKSDTAAQWVKDGLFGKRCWFKCRSIQKIMNPDPHTSYDAWKKWFQKVQLNPKQAELIKIRAEVSEIEKQKTENINKSWFFGEITKQNFS